MTVGQELQPNIFFQYMFKEITPSSRGKMNLSNSLFLQYKLFKCSFKSLEYLTFFFFKSHYSIIQAHCYND